MWLLIVTTALTEKESTCSSVNILHNVLRGEYIYLSSARLKEGKREKSAAVNEFIH